MKTKETRYRECPEFRVDGEEESKTLVGYAAMFDSATDMGEFDEIIAPGAFAKTIQEADVRCLWNHNSDIVLGRNKSGTLVLSEDETGLKIECAPSEASSIAKDCVETVRRGDVSQMSFGFYPIKTDWAKNEDGKPVRTLRECALFDVSPVTYPAYQDTEINLRSALKNSGAKSDLIEYILREQPPLETPSANGEDQPPKGTEKTPEVEDEPVEPDHSPLTLRQAQLKLMEI